jgi:hypothetical protein
MDMESTNNAIRVAEFPKNITEWVWVKNRNAFEVY